jgi:cell wall-associated NlpC family hydrolase
VAFGALVVPAGATAAPGRFADPIAEYAGGALWLARSSGVPSVESPTFVAWRARVAGDVAARLDLDAAHLEAVWSAADVDHQVALLAALSQLGAPYRRRSSDPEKGFDCSGLTAYAWGQAGFSLPRNSTSQWRVGDPRTIASAQAGDLLRYPGHVMMWLGVGRAVVHSPEPGGVVEVIIVSERSFNRSAFFDPT